MPLLALNTEAAERYLNKIPLVSLIEANTAPLLQKELERQVSYDSNISGSIQDSSVHDGSVLAHMGLDVHRAEKFLKSLDVELKLMDSRTSSKSDLQARASERRSYSLCLDPASRPEHGPEKWQTVVGGWKSRSDLNRLTPGLVRKGLVGGRVIMSTGQTSTYISSVRPPNLAADNSAVAGILDVAQDKLPITSPASSSWMPHCMRRRALSPRQGGKSYAGFLAPGEGEKYDPDFLDDRSLQQGTHHTVLRLEGYQVSVIPFVRPRRLKEELNYQFRCSHPQVHPSLTLSKLRNLQKDLREITLVTPELDISSVAIAWVYFEKLILGDYVRKSNRKLLAGACLMLAYKFNQCSGSPAKEIKACIRKLDRHDQLDAADLDSAELKIFVCLQFGLHVERAEVMPHLYRMLADLSTTHTEYYGPQIIRNLNQEWKTLDEDFGESGPDVYLPGPALAASCS